VGRWGDRGIQVIDWNRPCGHGCVVGKPKGMATNGSCKHAEELHQWVRLVPDTKELANIIRKICQDRARIAQELRRWQAGEQIESDYIDPFETEV
jgi:hypothetical protein